MFTANKRDGHYSVASPETSKPTAGVATMTKQPDITVPVEPITKEYKEAVESGRMCISLCTLECKELIYCNNIYG